MTLIVEKFGGTSVGTIDRINAVADHLKGKHESGESLVVVVSAMSGETNRLMGLAKELSTAPVTREMDVLLSTGEQVTIALLSIALQERGLGARSFTGGQIRILTDSVHGKARIQKIEDQNIRAELEQGNIVIVAGFQGADEHGNITTLGRGGSDTSAVALAAALKADECRIYTDVNGIYTTDPRIEPEARRLDRITFEEMLELASAGAKVLQSRAVEFAGKYKVPLRVLSSFEPDAGTLIFYESGEHMEQPLVSGIAYQKDEAKLTIRGIPDQPGVAHRVLAPISSANINVDIIIQNLGADGETDMTFTVPRDDFVSCKMILENTAKELGAAEVLGDSNIAKLAVVGVGMRSHSGVADTMFKALADEGINIQMISTSEIKVSVVIDDRYLELAVRALHKAFELAED